MTAETIDTIAAAVAARYAPGTMAAPGGLPAVRASTADLPNRLGRLPIVLTFLDSIESDSGGGTRISTITFLTRFYLARRRDLPRETNRINTWLPTLLGQLQGAVQLGGLAQVARAYTAGARVGTMRYGNLDYAGVELRNVVIASIAWTAVA